ncbi:nitroreductase [Clostridium sp. Marseille-P299]|uniref:nitroreductase n=1 Tax=Clostridium sp. Marseille-P299 TaxID=1805477 RepID=UPI000831496B|nr:nitroreductase [Clostridium sp. Marseille-P299]
MNSTVKDILERRSIRKFKPEQITEDELNTVLKAGMYAPTAMNRQSPIMVVLQNKETIEKVAKLNAKVMGREANPFYGAPTVIIVFADSTIGTYIEDGSLVMGNLMNAAHAIGLGSCWVHRAKEVFESEEGKALLKEWGVDEKYVGIANCLLGYKAMEQPKAAPRKDDYVIYVK